MFVDAMEIANVLGIKGLRALLSNTENLQSRSPRTLGNRGW
jgi:hypothetical protein